MTISVLEIDIDRAGRRLGLLLRAGEEILLFSLTLTQQPVSVISAPEGFLRFCQQYPGLDKRIFSVLDSAIAGMPLTFPVILPDSEAPTLALNLPQGDGPVWSSRHGYHLGRETIARTANLLADRGDTSLFPRTFEFSTIRRNDDLLGLAQKIDLLSHPIRDHRQTSAPKSSGGTRLATQLDPLDTILMTGLVREIGTKLEDARLPAEESIVHSFRFADSGSGALWSDDLNYASFQQHTEARSRRAGIEFVVVADIASFYSSISPLLIRDVLERANVSRKAAHSFVGMFAGSGITGLPVGPAASAIVAEATLNASDHVLRTAGASFVRFHDDYRIFCSSQADALGKVQILTDALWRTSRLRLNPRKTAIVPSIQFLSPDTVERDWLGRLSKTISEYDFSGKVDDLPDHERELAKSARAVFEKAIAPSHPLWGKLLKRSLSALAPEFVLFIWLSALGELHRLWPLARELAQYARRATHNRPESRLQLAVAFAGLPISSDAAIPDYARAWLATVFSSQPSTALASLFKRWTASPIALREAILALAPDQDMIGQLQFDRRDAWAMRAYVVATKTRLADISSGAAGSAAKQWHQTLMGDLAAHNTDE